MNGELDFYLGEPHSWQAVQNVGSLRATVLAGLLLSPQRAWMIAWASSTARDIFTSSRDHKFSVVEDDNLPKITLIIWCTSYQNTYIIFINSLSHERVGHPLCMLGSKGMGSMGQGSMHAKVNTVPCCSRFRTVGRWLDSLAYIERKTDA